MDIKPQSQQTATSPEANLSSLESQPEAPQYSDSIINTPTVQPEKKGVAKKVLIILLVLILSLGSGAAGWVYGKSKEESSSGAQITRLNSEITSLKKDKTSLQKQLAKLSKPATTSTQSYVTVKEWGIKVPNTPTGNTITYQISKSNSDIADFVSSEQKALGGTCGTFEFARYHLFRATSDYKAPAGSQLAAQLENAAKNSLTAKVGSTTYYILVDMTGGDCTGALKTGESMSQKEVGANQGLQNALKSLVSAS